MPDKVNLIVEFEIEALHAEPGKSEPINIPGLYYSGNTGFYFVYYKVIMPNGVTWHGREDVGHDKWWKLHETYVNILSADKISIKKS